VFMRQQALQHVGYLPTGYHLILDHTLWVQIAAHYPIIHVDENWAVERTHSDAKTIAQSARFVDEAFQFIQSMEQDPTIQSFFAHHRKDIYAGLHIFAARRLIDADQPRLALGHFRQAARFSISKVLSVWYKVCQALGGALGLGKVFLSYRQLRRRIQHRSQHLIVTETGVSVSDVD
jgi:hypothetical protein